jgi:hypothetical protein
MTKNGEGKKFLQVSQKKIVTDDEIWVFYYNAVLSKSPSSSIISNSNLISSCCIIQCYTRSATDTTNTIEQSPSRSQTSQPVKKFPAFYGTKGLITAYTTRAHHQSLY